MQRLAVSAGALILLLCTILYETLPDELYLNWRKSNSRQPAVAETAAENYLRIAPEGPRARILRMWLNTHQHTSQSSRVVKSRFVSKKPGENRQASAGPHIQWQAATNPEKSQASTIFSTQKKGLGSQAREADNTHNKLAPGGPYDGEHGLRPTGRSLEETLAFIAGKIASQDEINITARLSGDVVRQLSYHASMVTIDPNRCQISFHQHLVEDGKGTPDQNHVVQLDLAKSIREEPIGQTFGDLDAAAAGGSAVHVYPEAYAVHITQWDKPSGDNLYFHDEVTAALIRRAAYHAQKLCSEMNNRSGSP